jgi:hypothetical protein
LEFALLRAGRLCDATIPRDHRIAHQEAPR